MRSKREKRTRKDAAQMVYEDRNEQEKTRTDNGVHDGGKRLVLNGNGKRQSAPNYTVGNGERRGLPKRNGQRPNTSNPNRLTSGAERRQALVRGENVEPSRDVAPSINASQRMSRRPQGYVNPRQAYVNNTLAMMRQTQARLGRGRRDPREEMILQAVDQALSGKNPSYSPERRFGPQGLTFDQSERVNQHKLNVRQQILEERKFERDNAKYREEFRQGRKDQEQEDATHDLEYRKAKHNAAMERYEAMTAKEQEAYDRKTAKEKAEWNKKKDQADALEKDRRYDLDRDKYELDLQQEERLANQALSKIEKADPKEKESISVTDQAPGMFIGNAIKEGYGSYYFYGDNGNLTDEGAQFLQQVDYEARQDPTASHEELSLRAVDALGFVTDEEYDMQQETELEPEAQEQRLNDIESIAQKIAKHQRKLREGDESSWFKSREKRVDDLLAELEAMGVPRVQTAKDLERLQPGTFVIYPPTEQYPYPTVREY